MFMELTEMIEMTNLGNILKILPRDAPPCLDDGHRHGRFGQLYLAHLPSGQRAGDGARRLSVHRLHQGGRAADPCAVCHLHGGYTDILAIGLTLSLQKPENSRSGVAKGLQ